MIESRVENKAQKFKTLWSGSLSSSPVWKLDNSWPSLGVIDLITHCFRGKDDLDFGEYDFVSQCAAYIAQIAHGCWEAYGGKVLVDQDQEGVFIRLTEGPLSEEESFKVQIERDLHDMLRQPPSPFPVFADFTRVLTPDSNLISPYSIGLLTAFTPSGSGPLFKNAEKASEFEKYIEEIIRKLARSSSENYARLYPEEPLGQVAELYLHDLIFPPMLLSEPLPGCTAVGGMVSFFEEYGVPKDSMLELCHNLALSTDELISSAGLAFYAALVQGELSSKVIAAAKAKKTEMALLRQAMLIVREALGFSPDWITRREMTEEDFNRIDVEIRLGFLPWLKLSRKKLALLPRDDDLADFLQAIADVNLARAGRVLERIIEETPSDIEMRVQQVHLLLSQGDFERAANELRAISTEPEASMSADFYHIWGVCDMAQQDFEAAIKHFKKGYSLAGSARERAAEIANDLAWSLLHIEQYEEALETLDEAIRHSGASVTVLLNKAHALHALGRTDEAYDIHTKDLAELAPTDRRVVRSMVLRHFSPSDMSDPK